MSAKQRLPAQHLAYGIQLLPRLTWRRKQVAFLHARGMKAGAIAFRLRIKEPTIRTHIDDIHETLGVESAAQLCGRAYEALLEHLEAHGSLPRLDDAFGPLRQLIAPAEDAEGGSAPASRP